MEIEDDPRNEQPKPDRKAKKAEPTPEISPAVELMRQRISYTVANASTGILVSKSKLNMLSFLLDQCAEAERMRSPEDEVTRRPLEKNIAERFLLDQAESPLLEAREAEKYFQALEIPVIDIDPTDNSGKSLSDYIDPERKNEIERAAAQLRKKEYITDQIQEVLIQSSPELLADFKSYQEIIQPLTREQNIKILLGENPKPKERENLDALLEENEPEAEAWSLLEAEKARILCRTATLPEGSERDIAREQCQELFGPDLYSLIEKQVQHTKNTIQKLYATEAEPTNSPQELFCPEMLERMGESGPSQQQIQTMEAVQDFYFRRRENSKPDPDEEIFLMARTALASLYVTEYGQWAQHLNCLKSYREKTKDIEREEFLEKYEEDPDKDPEEIAEEIGMKLDPENLKSIKKLYYRNLMKKVGTIIHKYNEGVIDQDQRVDKEKILKNLEKASGATAKGLRQLEEEDIQKGGCPKVLAKTIAQMLNKNKQRKKGITAALAGATNHGVKRLQQRFFEKTFEDIGEELYHKKGKDFGSNEGMQRSMRELGIHQMDHPG